MTDSQLLLSGDLFLVLCGAATYWLCPRLRRNWFVGYGSPRSMINDAAWQMANRFAGLSLALLALLTMCGHIAVWPLLSTSDVAVTASITPLILLPFLVMYLTEKYLSRRFRN